uniref:Uncharacterized protein n=1 Tax=Oryza meridionalis TaxID=40149 RepID=A0A0E0E8F9_9ORYZ
MAISAAFLRSALPAVVASKGSGAPSLTGAAAAARVAFSAVPARYAPLASVEQFQVGLVAVIRFGASRHPRRQGFACADESFGS